MSTEDRNRAAIRIIKDMGLYDFYKGQPLPPPGSWEKANHSRLWFIHYKRKTRLKMLDIIFETRSKA